jgi:virginiamycin B lyase
MKTPGYLLQVLRLTAFGLFAAISLCPAQTGTFQQVSGSLSQISVGADGAVWGLDPNHNIFIWDSASSQFMQIPGQLVQIAVGNANAVWGLNSGGYIYRWDSVQQDWTPIPGNLQAIAVGADGDVWGTNSGGQIWHYNQQAQSWTQVGLNFTPNYYYGPQLTVGNSGSVYLLASISPGFEDPFWYNPGTGEFQFLAGNLPTGPDGALTLGSLTAGADGDLWSTAGGFAAHFDPLQPEFDVNTTGPGIAQIAVGSATNVWGIDYTSSSGGPVYQFSAESDTWVSAGITLSQIAAGADGSVWGVNSQNQVFHYSGSTQPPNSLRPIPGSFQQISVAADGTAWAVDANNYAYNFNRQTQSFQIVSGELAQVSSAFAGGAWGVNAGGAIWLWNAPPNSASDMWGSVPGELNQIAVAANGAVFGINAAGQTYMYPEQNWLSPAGFPLPADWINIPGSLVQLATGVDGTTWGINQNQQIYRYNGSSNSWVNIPGSLVQISVGNAENVWGVNAAQRVYRYDASIPGWVEIPGALLTQIAVAFDGAVWGVNAEDSLYQWSPATQTFDFVANGVTNVAVGNNSAVFAWSTNTGATYWYF